MFLWLFKNIIDHTVNIIGIQVPCHVIQKLVDVLHSFLGGYCVLTRDFNEDYTLEE